MQWQNDNKLERGELQETIRNNWREKKDKNIPLAYCACLTCSGIEYKDKPFLSTDVHHLDGNHSNNESTNLAPACKVCHSDEHGITPQMNELKLLTRTFYSVQNHRMALANRVRAYEHLHLPTEHLKLALEDIEASEKKMQRHLIIMLKDEPFYNSWLKKVKGIGPLLAASLMAELGSPEGFKTVGQLMAYSGMDVRNGEAPRRKRGEKANWNGNIRMTLFKAASSFIKKTDCFGRKLYDEYKTYYIERDGAEPKWKPHRRAMRRVEKDFLRCMWRAWMISRNLPLSKPHANTKVFEQHWL